MMLGTWRTTTLGILKLQVLIGKVRWYETEDKTE